MYTQYSSLSLKTEKYVEILLSWNSRINLVSRETEHEVLERHIKDSFSLLPYISGGKVLDVGSGAGFPGIFLSLADVENVFLCEKDYKKAAFLREVKRKLGLSCEVLETDVRTIRGNYDIITCRAFAPLLRIFDLCFHLMNSENKFLLLKGANYEEEIFLAKKFYKFDFNVFLRDNIKEGVVLEVKNIQCHKK